MFGAVSARSSPHQPARMMPDAHNPRVPKIRRGGHQGCPQRRGQVRRGLLRCRPDRGSALPRVVTRWQANGLLCRYSVAGAAHPIHSASPHNVHFDRRPAWHWAGLCGAGAGTSGRGGGGVSCTICGRPSVWHGSHEGHAMPGTYLFEMGCYDGVRMDDDDEYHEGWQTDVVYPPCRYSPLACKTCGGTGDAPPLMAEALETDECVDCRGTGWRDGNPRWPEALWDEDEPEMQGAAE